MRNEAFLIAGAVAALMATACDKASSITGPEAPYGKRADALTSHTEQDVPWDDIPAMIDPCNKDEITFTGGSTHFVFGSTFNTSGIHLSMSVSSRGTGTGLPPDSFVYKVSDQTNDSVQEPVGPQFTMLDEASFLILAPKSD